MPQTTEQPKDYASPQEHLANQDWAGVAKKGISSLTPAETGWILGFVVIFALFQLSNYMIGVEREKRDAERAVRLNEYFHKLEDSRLAIEVNRAQEIRRLQEMVKSLTETVARGSERKARQQIQTETIEQVKQP